MVMPIWFDITESYTLTENKNNSKAQLEKNGWVYKSESGMTWSYIRTMDGVRCVSLYTYGGGDQRLLFPEFPEEPEFAVEFYGWSSYIENRQLRLLFSQNVYIDISNIWVGLSNGSTTELKYFSEGNRLRHYGLEWSSTEIKLYMDCELIITMSKAPGNGRPIEFGYNQAAASYYNDNRFANVRVGPTRIGMIGGMGLPIDTGTTTGNVVGSADVPTALATFDGDTSYVELPHQSETIITTSFTNPIPLNSDVLGVKITTQNSKSNSGGVSGTVSVSDGITEIPINDLGLSVGYRMDKTLLPENPITESPWVISDFDSLNVIVKETTD